MMGRIEDRLGKLGLVLPSPMDPPGNFELVTVYAGIAYIAGRAPIDGFGRARAGRGWPGVDGRGGISRGAADGTFDPRLTEASTR